MLERLYFFLGTLGAESSLYDSYLMANRGEVLWYFLCFVLGGLFAALFLKKPEKEEA